MIKQRGSRASRWLSVSEGLRSLHSVVAVDGRVNPLSSKGSYRAAFEPRIGSEAVSAYLAYRRTLVVGRLLAIPAWLILFVGIGLSSPPTAVAGGLLVVANGYYIFKRGRGRRRQAQDLAKKHLSLPDSAAPPPVAGNAELFDVWLKLRARGAVRDQNVAG